MGAWFLRCDNRRLDGIARERLFQELLPQEVGRCVERGEEGELQDRLY